VKVRLGKAAAAESKKLKGEMKDWEDFYKRFKPRLDELLGYEEKIRDLESELDKKEKIVKVDLEEKKHEILFLTGAFLIASLLFLRVVSKFENQWAFFGAGLLVGIGLAYLSRFWLNIV